MPRVLAQLLVLSRLVVFADLVSVHDVSRWALLGGGRGKHPAVITGRHVASLVDCCFLVPVSHGANLVYSLLIVRSSPGPNCHLPGCSLT